MRIALLSPYHGGSHRAWAEGWASRSRHRIEVLGLPAQFWKWRMHGAAVRLAEEYRLRFPAEPADVIVTNDMLDLTTFLSLTRRETAEVPALFYAHENQWTYPLPADPTTGPMRRQKGERDRHYAWINFVSMLAADRIAFNSAFHRREFLSSLPAFLNHYPDEKDPAWIGQIESRSSVLPLGIDLSRFDPRPPASSPSGEPDRSAPPIVLWNHRWEYDKDPEAFFRAIDAVAARGASFRLAVCGTNVRTQTPEFDAARERHAARLVHWGEADARVYPELLRRADVLVSTARHEFFGTAVCEAVYCGAYPLLPNRLSYPDLIPSEFHHDVLYDGTEDLIARLALVLADPARLAPTRRKLQAEMARHDWSRRASEYDRQIEVWFGAR